MEIYVVQSGDTINSIADMYGVTVDRLIRDNEMTDPYNLVPGEVIIILYPSQTYTIQSGDTLESIAASNNISVSELLRNNPFLSGREYIFPGEVLTISYDRIDRVATHGFAFTYINTATLRKTLPYLTYLSVYNYRTAESGELIGTNDDIAIVELAKEFGVIPFLLVTTLTVAGEVDLNLTNEVLVNEEVQNRLIDNALRIVQENGYYGINLSAQFITAENQNLFYNYAQKLSDRLRQNGYLFNITVNPRIDSTFDNELTYELIDYSSIAGLVDGIIFLQYRWGISIGPPSPIISVRNTGIFLDYAQSLIEDDKITTGFPIIGYIWELPYLPGFTRGSALTRENALNLAREYGATIQFDEVSQTPYYFFIDTNDNTNYVVWFINAITINSLLDLLTKRNIHGTGVWNIMSYFPHLWLVINSQYEIIKLLPEL